VPVEVAAVQLVEHLDHTDHPAPDHERRAHDGPRDEAGGLIDFTAEARVVGHIVHDQWDAMTGDPPGDAGLEVQPQVLQRH